MRSGNPSLKVAVIGGSVAGLCAGITLCKVGCDVHIYERTGGVMASRGAGIVVQQELRDLLRRHGIGDLPATTCRRRQYLIPDGGNGATAPSLQRFTSWSAIHRTLRSAFPDDRYHRGSTVTDFEQTDRGTVLHLAEGGDLEADIVVSAEGSRSATRRRLLPAAEPGYAGYVAWRGTVEEGAAVPELVRFFDESFALCPGRSGGHILCYFIPGPGEATDVGLRRLNWVWYVNVSDGQPLTELLTDRAGRLNEVSIMAGMVRDALVAELHAAAAKELHPCFADLVQSTPDPFLQVIFDVAVPRMAFGRACLLGDAAFVLRPHPGAATAKASADAMALAAALAADPSDPVTQLRAWETRQLDYGLRLLNHAIALGRRSVDVRGSATLREAIARFEGIALMPPR
jgi:2-polyprenyl-6-methoxyphenol hydroxylase-like FAD-dependent oxidoreductase